MSKNSFDKEVLEFSSVMNSGYLFLINNAGKAIALITIIVTVLLTFTDVSFGGFLSEDFGGMLAVMLLSSYIIYFSLEESGEALGKESEEYLTAIRAYKEVKGKISPDAIYSLRAFCSDYTSAELDYRRSSFLMERGYSVDEYNSYKSRGTTDKKAKRVFRKADKLKAIRLSPSILLSGERMGLGGELENPSKKKLLTTLRILIPSTACMIFTISVILTAKGELTPTVIINGLLKLSALPIIGFRAYGAGYSYVKHEKSAWIEAKARLLTSFIGNT